MAEFTSVLAVLAIARGVRVLIEQPSSSLLREYKYTKSLFGSLVPYKVPVAVCCYGAESVKPITVFSSEPEAITLRRKRP
eukprot:11359156-Alexandrium_andersonii.AAC.1